MKKKYIEHKKVEHQKKRDRKVKESDISSDPDYEQIMAEGHIIIIKEQDTKKQYLTHLKKERQVKKVEEKTAEKRKPPQKKFESDEEQEDMAEGDIVIIGEESKNLTKEQIRKRNTQLEHYKRLMDEEKHD